MSRYNLYPATDFERLIQREPQQILNLMLEIAESSRQHPDSAYVVQYKSIPLLPPQSKFKPQAFGWLYIGENQCREVVLPVEGVVMERLQSLLPFHSDLSWEGYVAAGSFAALLCQPYDVPENNPGYIKHQPSDIDFYPYCSRENRGELSMEEAALRSYTRWLDDMTTVIENGEDDPLFESQITIRNSNCTTITGGRPSMQSDNPVTTYQIIHRAHTSATSVVVGFDQMACKAFYDGDQVYLTLDAALCLYFGINPVDWRRESPSHLRRTHKYYKYGYVPIFPGLKLDIADLLAADEQKMYYLPGCLLGGRKYCTNTYSRATKTKKATDEQQMTYTHMAFENYEVKEYFKWKHENHRLDDYDAGRFESIVKRLLNIEDMPAVPFSQEAKESDYSSETTEYMAHCYHILSLVIREKYNLFSLYTCDGPNRIIDAGEGINVRAALKKVMVGHHSDFYFGTDRVNEIQREMSRMVLNNHSHMIGLKLLSDTEMQKLSALQRELRQIFEARTSELEALIEPQVARLQEGVKFITCNPGAQFTASFKPIIRQKPQDYWGKLYTPVEPSRLRQIKITLLCIRKFHNTTLRQLDKNIMRMIFECLDMAYFRQDQEVNHQVVSAEHQVPAAASLFIKQDIKSVVK